MIANLNLSSATRWGLNFLILLGGVVALHLGQSIFIPTVIALLLAAMLWPMVRWLRERMFLPWTFSCMVVVLGLVAVNLILTLSLIPLTIKLLQDIPGPDDKPGQIRVYEQFRTRVIDVVPLLSPYLPANAEESQAFQYVQRTLKGPYMTDALVQLVTLGNNWLWQWVLIMFILLFLLMEGPMLTRRVVEIFGPSEEIQARVGRALEEMAESVRTYLVWRTIINIALAFAVGAVYERMGLKQPWTWAFLTAILCYVPYIGPLAAGVPPVLDAFITVSPKTALAVALFYLVLLVIEGYLVVPLVMGRRMELNATTVMLACLFWERMWGLSGLFLAMPLMAAIKAVCYNVPEWRPWANLMSTRWPLLRPKNLESQTAPIDETQVLLPDELAALDAGPPSRRQPK